jgi:hypothetical protein
VLGPPLGNASLQWREWAAPQVSTDDLAGSRGAARGLVDELVINQNSSQCPSMWHHLWPMHRGYGYVQNYLDGLPPLREHLASTYAPIFAPRPSATSAEEREAASPGARLYVARQWDERDEAEEAALLAQPGVAGLVFSSFRHDNPGPVARADWRA